MATKRAQLIAWFKNGLYPDESQFAAWIDSFFHKTEDTIPISSVDGLSEQLNGKFPTTAGTALQQQADEIRADLTEHEESNAGQFADIEAQQVNQDTAIGQNASDIESLRLRSTMTSGTIIVDEIPRKRSFYLWDSIGEERTAVMISRNRPVNYTFFTKDEIWYALAEMKFWYSKITSQQSLNNGATFNVESVPSTLQEHHINLKVDVYTPVKQITSPADNSNRAIYFTLPGAASYPHAAVIEYNSNGTVINTKTISTNDNRYPGIIALKLNSNTAAIRVKFEAAGIGMCRFAIYTNQMVWSQYLPRIYSKSGIYAMTRQGHYKPVGVSKVPRILNKANNLIATPVNQYQMFYTVSKYTPPVGDCAEILYGKIVQNPLEAIRIINNTAGPNSAVKLGVFVKMKHRRRVSRQKRESIPYELRKERLSKTSRNNTKWALYTGISRAAGYNNPPYNKPFPDAIDAYNNSGSLNSYFKKFFKPTGTWGRERVMHAECLVAFVETGPKGVVCRPVGEGVRFRLVNKKMPGSYGPITKRVWVVERA